jgi:YbbR domain-containing protein
MIRKMSNNWLAKLGALVCAVLLWLFVTSSNNVEASSEFTLPVVYNGIKAEQIVRGAPASVLVKVIGRRNQLSSLNAENFSAFIDFTGTEGSYEKNVEVVLPAGVRQVSVTPATAIGTVETITTKTVPVETSLLGLAPDNTKADLTTTLLEARVLGLSSSLEQVSKVVATVPAQEGNVVVTLFAADTNNQPIKDTTLSVSPNTIMVTVSFKPILISKRLKLSLSDATFSAFDTAGLGLSSIKLSQDSINVIGPETILDSLEELAASVEPITTELKSGEYTLKVIPSLPEGVTATEAITLTLTLASLDEPLPTNEINGEPDDSARAPLRRPDSTQESPPRNFFRR